MGRSTKETKGQQMRVGRGMMERTLNGGNDDKGSSGDPTKEPRGCIADGRRLGNESFLNWLIKDTIL